MRHQGGFLLFPTLCIVGLLGLVLAGYFTAVHTDLRLTTRAVGNAQALGLAEAGLVAARNRFAQQWDLRQETLNPLRETVLISSHGDTSPIGGFDVTTTPLTPDTLQFISTGRVPVGPTTAMTRTIAMVVVAQHRPVFQEQQHQGTLVAEMHDADADGFPDLLTFSGDLEISSAGSGFVAHEQEAFGGNYMASFTDVNHDGELDLVLLNTPASQLPTDHQRIEHLAVIDLFHNGTPVLVVTPGWMVLPDGNLNGSESHVQVFFNHLLYAGTVPISWMELLSQ